MNLKKKSILLFCSFQYWNYRFSHNTQESYEFKNTTSRIMNTDGKKYDIIVTSRKKYLSDQDSYIG